MSKLDKKKKIIIASIVGVVVLALVIFLIWFFNRKFDVAFDYNNGTKEEVVQVKYKKTIDEKDIKDEKDLGDLFIDWYMVKEVKDGEDILEKEPFDFESKITKDIKLKAVYEEKVETITVTFDSKGGSKVDSIILNKGAQLTLPKSPTYKGYNFIGWYYENGDSFKDKTALDDDTTLIAKWEKIVEKAKEVEKQVVEEEPKKEEEIKVESISLSLTSSVIHANGTNSSSAIVKTENVSGNVKYSISDDTCMSIDESTGVIKAKSIPAKGGQKAMYDRSCAVGQTVTVSATTPSGKVATAKINYEKDLSLTVTGSNASGSNDAYSLEGNDFTVIANQNVTWGADYDNCTYEGESSKTSTTFTGKNYNYTCTLTNGNTTGRTQTVQLTAKTTGGQTKTIKLSKIVN